MRLPRRKGPAEPVHAVRRTGQPGPRFNYELFNCNNFNIRYWSWNYRGCWPNYLTKPRSRPAGGRSANLKPSSHSLDIGGTSKPSRAGAIASSHSFRMESARTLSPHSPRRGGPIPLRALHGSFPKITPWGLRSGSA